MSSPDLRLALTPAAREDYEDILLYTLQAWGPEQHARYAADLERGLVSLLTHPSLGRLRPDLPPGCRTYRIGQHIAVYDVRGDTLRVLRILHHRRDIAGALRDPS